MAAFIYEEESVFDGRSGIFVANIDDRSKLLEMNRFLQVLFSIETTDHLSYFIKLKLPHFSFAD